MHRSETTRIYACSDIHDPENPIPIVIKLMRLPESLHREIDFRHKLGAAARRWVVVPALKVAAAGDEAGAAGATLARAAGPRRREAARRPRPLLPCGATKPAS